MLTTGRNTKKSRVAAGVSFSCTAVILVIIASAALLFANDGASTGFSSANQSSQFNRQVGGLPDPSDELGQSNASDRPDMTFATLDEAVAAGMLDPEVVTDLQTNGSVQAFITVTDKDLVPDSIRSMPAGQARVERTVASIRTTLAPRKAKIMTSIGADVTPLAEYENLGMSLVQFRSADALLKALNNQDVTGVRADHISSLQLAESLPLINQPAAATAGYRGNGTFVAVLDTGADYTLVGCSAPNVPTTCPIFYAKDFAANDNRLDDDGHGSNVAGIVAGVAPGTKIFALDVMQRGPNGLNGASDSVVIAAINQVIDWKVKSNYNFTSINMSLGSGSYTQASCPKGSYAEAFRRALDADIIPVVAAGNSGTKDGIASPACVPGALSVGAVYDANVGGLTFAKSGPCTDQTTSADRITCFSQSSSQLAMLAPGACIVAGGIRVPGACNGGMSGTSQATPHVAGAIAVLAAAKPSAHAPEIQAALVGSGPILTDSNGVSRHRLDVYAALQTLLKGGSATTDKTAPAVTAPFQEMQLGTAGSTVPVRVSWSANDASGIAQYRVMASTDGGAWTDQLSANSSVTNKAFALTIGSTYQFIAAAQDRAGNWSGWTYGPKFTVYGVYQENNEAVTYAGSWTRMAYSAASGGYITASAAANAKTTFTFTGSNVAWIATKGTNRGQAYVYLDGAYQQTIDLYSSTTAAQSLVYGAAWATSGSHTLTVVVVGTPGRPNVDVDGFVIMR